MSSILNDVKKNLDIDPAYTAFDLNVVMLINGVLSKLTQLGVGPVSGFYIEDDTAQWEALLGTDPRWNMVKPYVYLSVKMAFDPPGTSHLVAALEKQLDETVWRIGVLRETLAVEAPATVILDGGEA